MNLSCLEMKDQLKSTITVPLKKEEFDLKHQRERGKGKRNKTFFSFFFFVANVVNISLFCISTETQESLIPTESAYPFLWNAHGLSLLRILQKVRPKNLQKKNYLRQ